MENQTIEPQEVSFEEAKQLKKLDEILSKKAEEKTQLNQKIGLSVLKKSKFYYGKNNELREHIATYQTKNGISYAILINQNKMKEEINPNEAKMFPVLIKSEDLPKLKKVNGNVVRKLQPTSLHKWDKMAMVAGAVKQIDEGL